MTNVFIIHGSYGSPEGNWFSWLKRELEKIDCNVYIPKFPTPENQSLDSWIEVFKGYEKYLGKDSIVVGHSLGVAFLLSALEKRIDPIRVAFFVSGFLGRIGNPEFDKVNKTFVSKNFNWEIIKMNCKKFYVFHSDNDPYVPLKKGEELADNLKVKLNIVKGGGHLNRESGYVKFDLLFDNIKNEITLIAIKRVKEKVPGKFL